MPHSARSHASGADVPALQLATSQVAAHAVVVKWKDRDVHGAAALLCIRLKVSNVFAANSERPRQRRPTGRRLPLFRHGDQAFALSLFPSSLARTSDGFRLLARLALRRFFIRLTTLHLTKNAFALHLLLWDPESLIDIVVANEYPQMFSDRATAALGGRDVGSDPIAVNGP
jgi:hypothetical protein